MRALVLSGGGARGAYEAGVISALVERESFDMVCGVSIGAINAGLVAAAPVGALEKFWSETFPTQAAALFPHVPHLRRLIDGLSGLDGGTPWQNALKLTRALSSIRALRKIDRNHHDLLQATIDALEKILDLDSLRMSLIAGATNISYNRPAGFYAVHHGVLDISSTRGVEYIPITKETFARSLLASSALPGLFHPIEMTVMGRRAQYADGGVVSNSPLGLAIENGATEVTVIFVDPENSQETDARIRSTGEIVRSLAVLWQQRLLEYEVRLAQMNNDLVAAGASTQRSVVIRYVRPVSNLAIDLLDFTNAEAMARVFALGREDAATRLTDVVLPVLPEGGQLEPGSAALAWWDLRRWRQAR